PLQPEPDGGRDRGFPLVASQLGQCINLGDRAAHRCRAGVVRSGPPVLPANGTLLRGCHMIAEPAIDVTGLGKRYVRAGPARRHDTLRDQLVASITDRRRDPRAFWALSDVSFKISRGENVGII